MGAFQVAHEVSVNLLQVVIGADAAFVVFYCCFSFVAVNCRWLRSLSFIIVNCRCPLSSLSAVVYRRRRRDERRFLLRRYLHHHRKSPNHQVHQLPLIESPLCTAIILRTKKKIYYQGATKSTWQK